MLLLPLVSVNDVVKFLTTTIRCLLGLRSTLLHLGGDTSGEKLIVRLETGGTCGMLIKAKHKLKVVRLVSVSALLCNEKVYY